MRHDIVLPITITAEMIEQGVPQAPELCPISLGFEQALPHHTAEVHRTHVVIRDRWGMPMHHRQLFTATAIGSLIGRFDHRQGMEPVTLIANWTTGILSIAPKEAQAQ